MFVALLLCWMACKACLGPTTGGGFLLAIFFCRLPLAQAPRPPVAKARDGSLLDRGRVTTQTHAVRQALLTQLEAWLRAQVPTYSLEDLARFHLSALSEWLEEYVVTLYVQGQSLRAAAETLNALAQKFGWLRGSLSGPWDVIRTWDTLEPVQHHPPMPVHVLRALVSCALAWNWSRMAIVMCLAFFGLLRPSESISLRRQDLALPEDHLQGDWLYIRIGQPKTRRRAAQQQHVRLDEPGVALWIQTMLTGTYVCAYLERLIEVFSH